MVVTQECTALPSTITVHEPQADTPQPNFVPVRPRSSRSTQSRRRSSSTASWWGTPFTVTEIDLMAALLFRWCIAERTNLLETSEYQRRTPLGSSLTSASARDVSSRRSIVVQKAGTPGNTKLFAALVVVVALIGVGTLGYVVSRPRRTPVLVAPSAPGGTGVGHLEGNADAPVQVVEFGDFECPHCAEFALVTEPDIRTKLINTGIVGFRF